MNCDDDAKIINYPPRMWTSCENVIQDQKLVFEFQHLIDEVSIRMT